MIDVLERVALCFEQEESPQHKLSKLEGFLVQYGLPLTGDSDHTARLPDGAAGSWPASSKQNPWSCGQP
jgi:hypothetical protein